MINVKVKRLAAFSYRGLKKQIENVDLFIFFYLFEEESHKLLPEQLHFVSAWPTSCRPLSSALLPKKIMLTVTLEHFYKTFFRKITPA